MSGSAKLHRSDHELTSAHLEICTMVLDRNMFSSAIQMLLLNSTHSILTLHYPALHQGVFYWGV